MVHERPRRQQACISATLLAKLKGLLSEHNDMFSKLKGLLSEHNDMLSKLNGLLSEHNDMISKLKVLLSEHNDMFSKLRRGLLDEFLICCKRRLEEIRGSRSSEHLIEIRAIEKRLSTNGRQ